VCKRGRREEGGRVIEFSKSLFQVCLCLGQWANTSLTSYQLSCSTLIAANFSSHGEFKTNLPEIHKLACIDNETRKDFKKMTEIMSEIHKLSADTDVKSTEKLVPVSVFSLRDLTKIGKNLSL